MPADSPPDWYRAVFELLEPLRCCISDLQMQIPAIPPDPNPNQFARRDVLSQALTNACEALSLVEALCVSAMCHLKQSTTPDAKWFESFQSAIASNERLSSPVFRAEVKAAIQALGIDSPIKPSTRERNRSATTCHRTTSAANHRGAIPNDWFMWRVTAELLASRVICCLPSGTLEPFSGSPLHGVLGRCETAASKIGDMARRMAISPTLETARTSIVNLAQQIVESGCIEVASCDLIALAEQVRDRIRGPVVTEEMENAAVQPIIVE